ncbi:MAG: hypothetical protein RLZZ303_2189 [Candidatus Hydrogenedentota bacterium]|jgi:hypothetical protein
MPTYTYQVIREDGSEGEVFEYVQRMSDPPLEEHPDTGEKVVRVFVSPHIAGRSHERIQKQTASDDNLARLGFAKYVRNGKGHYEKHVGDAKLPGELHSD